MPIKTTEIIEPVTDVSVNPKLHFERQISQIDLALLPQEKKIQAERPARRERVLDLFSMKGKRCVVTGAGRGLGNMVVRALIEAGSTSVALLDLHQESVDQAKEELMAWYEEDEEGPREKLQALAVACDVSNEEVVQSAMASIAAEFGGSIDVLITAAGVVENIAAEKYPSVKVKKLLDINVMGTWYCATEASKYMANGGTMVFFGSMSGHIVNVPQPQAPYNFSKAAVSHMCKSLAVEWAPRGIRVNTICPGYVRTAMAQSVIDQDPDMYSEWCRRTPLGRMANPEDLSGTIILLASNASRYTTGSDLFVDGGYTCV